MKADKIKSIPNNIVSEIKKRAYKEDARTRYVSYLTTNDRELVKVTVATKWANGKLYLKQCSVHGLDSDKCFVRDMEFTYMGGYQVGWYSEGLAKNPKYYEDGVWYDFEEKYFNPYAPLINPEYLSRFPEFKYSAWELYKGDDIIAYLKTYRDYPQTEFLLKFGLADYMSKNILKQIGKDKKFRKWLCTNAEELKHTLFYSTSVIKAYKENKPLTEVQYYEEQKKSCTAPIRNFFGKDINKYIDYSIEKEIGHLSYLDYLTACDFIGLDMTLDKNRMPHNFKHWHDVRIDEYKTAKAKKDAEERKAFYNKFSKVAEKYSELQYNKNDAYVVVIAHSPAELVKEGKVLKHCVGSMGYDQKFVREETLIFFVRTKDNPSEPFVTVEYSLKSKKILQCYGKGNSKPNSEVTTYINNIWNPYAKKMLKKMAA